VLVCASTSVALARRLPRHIFASRRIRSGGLPHVDALSLAVWEPDWQGRSVDMKSMRIALGAVNRRRV
jgi:hypothetical protein